MLRHICGGLGAPRQTELVEDPAHIVLHRLLGQEQRLADLTVGATLSQSRENLALLFRERGERGVVTAALAHALVVIAQQDAGLLRHQRATSERIGTSKCSREPLPGAASTWSWPPTAKARSRMFRRPWPSVAFA